MSVQKTYLLHGRIPSYTGNQKQESADKVTLNRPEKPGFGQRHIKIAKYNGRMEIGQHTRFFYVK